MQEVVREGVVDAPVERVWPLVDEVTRMGEWFAFAERMEHLAGVGVGRQQRLHGRWGSRRSEVDQEVTAYDPPHALAWRHVAERLDGKPAPRFARSTEFRITLEPQPMQHVGMGSSQRPHDGATLVRMCSRQEPASAVKGLVMRMFGTREVANLMERSLVRLAEAVRR